ncbi:TolC family protein [Stieleria magnilauensis]|uniref:Cobalt-zinc-cadmium resistance protein CzcC n=1 Tax=Stieleria magnilauensis TaxID=2527963 RepID=A0ABX5XUX9_9BACT|nr:Cobalt-zinc-cadmium resistance protein CzcC precursor [Planctomycetes bacterium TBK1r]
MTQVGFDEFVTEAEQLTVTQTEQAFGTTVEISDNVSLLNTGGLSLSDAESLAVASHPALAEARSKVESIRGQYVQAGLPYNPVVQYQSDEIGNDNASGLHSLSVSQQFVTANKLGIAQQVQAQAMQKQKAQMQATELRVLTRVRAAFAQALIAQQRVKLTRKIVELAEKSIASVESLVEAQEVSKVALLQARVEAEQVRITAENAETQLEANRRELAAATGAGTLPTGPLVGNISDGLTQSPWEQLLSDVTTASPEMAEAGSELERARWALQLACAQVTPNITGQIGVGVDTATDDTFARIGVSMPLPIRNRNQGGIRTARADIAAASAAIDRTRLSLQSRLAEALGRYETARQRYERINNNVLANAQETYELSQKAFNAEQTGYLQLLTAQRTLFNTQLNALDSAAQAKRAIAEIEGLLVTIAN